VDIVIGTGGAAGAGIIGTGGMDVVIGTGGAAGAGLIETGGADGGFIYGSSLKSYYK
jgi:hypothetical protein